MLVAHDRDTPQTKNRLALPFTFSAQELMMTQEPPWLWLTLLELGFPLFTDEYCRPIHLEIEEYMRKYVANDQDWEKVDDEDYWGMNYTEPTSQIREKMETILHTLGGEQPEEEQDKITKLNPERERFSIVTSPATRANIDKILVHRQIFGTHPSYTPIRVIKRVNYRSPRVRTVTWKGIPLIVNISWSKLPPKTVFSQVNPLFPSPQISPVPKFSYVGYITVSRCGSAAGHQR